MNYIVLYKMPHPFMSYIEISKIALYSELQLLDSPYAFRYLKLIWKLRGNMIIFLKGLSLKNLYPLVSIAYHEYSG